MPANITFKKVFSTLENALNIASQRHGQITSTLSNQETPGYRPKDIDFKAALNQAMSDSNPVQLQATNARHMGTGTSDKFVAEAVDQEGVWNGFNWVSIDQTMSKLIENNLLYRTATESLLRKINTIKEVIREGGH